MRRSLAMSPLIVVVIFALYSSQILVKSCPEIIKSLCLCEDLHNGVLLDCSNSDGTKVVQVLRTNQALLGLVQGLTMRNSTLSSIPASFLAGLYIKRLDLSHNQMTEINDNAFSGMSPVMQELILTHNNLTKIPVAALASLGTLLRVDFSNNSIGDILDSDAFPSLPKLYDINLGSNNICSIHSSAFQNVKNSIQRINLGHNCLHSVPSSSIRGLKQLQALHMQNNNISSLDALNFLNLPVLNLLNLAGNAISEINRQAFLNVPQLKYLYLTNNKIRKLNPRQFASFDQIEMIDLTGNDIAEIPSKCMAELPQLRQLFLGGNRIHSIGKNAFANSSIVILSLINNQLTEITEGILDNMPNLQSVAFKNNKIKKVSQNAFYNTPSVVMIDLSNNEITDLPPSTFLAQLNLQMIDLRNNKIIRTPYAAFNRRIGTVFLQENPLVCTEKIHMLQDGVAVYIETSEDLICGGVKVATTTLPPVKMPKLSTRRPNTQNAMKPSGAFQQVGLIRNEQPLRRMEPILIRPIVANEQLNSSKTKEVTRSRGPHLLEFSRNSFQENIEEELTQHLDSKVIQQHITTESNEPIDEEVNTTAKITTIGQLHQDIADNPNIIHPFPVPFLKKSSAVHEAVHVKSFTQSSSKPTEKYTLPPSIVIAPRPNLFDVQRNTIDNTDHFEKFALESHTSTSSKKDPADIIPHQAGARLASSTFIIVISLTAVAVVMVSVVVGLCIMRHREIRRFTSSHSDISAARTNAYVSAQTAQMNAMYGTMERSRNMNLARPNDVQPWLYNPGHNYCNYYK
ncbi:leucine Rich repeat-containing domain protein [Dictyocaulus viviparus]|uniref:Leucine Rich repeat-containing domain protein n=1 Tax=Dictyocaulus viviparus TaxID=29172 RepID=A0A0D8XD65_DICVI|nr:leucine Rich repeat-containing domain protein [Dictyocaulus viviparus]